MFRVSSLIAAAVLTIFNPAASEAGQAKHHLRYHHGHHASVGFSAYVGVKSKIVVAGPRLTHRPLRIAHHVHKASGCSVAQASFIAREYGIRYQTVYRNKRTMNVVGYRHGRPALICISRAPGCSIVEWG